MTELPSLPPSVPSVGDSVEVCEILRERGEAGGGWTPSGASDTPERWLSGCVTRVSGGIVFGRAEGRAFAHTIHSYLRRWRFR